MIERGWQAWAAMAPRERRLIGVGAGVLALAVIYLALIEPAWKGRATLERELPVLRQQLSQMLALGTEVRQLAAAPASAARGVQALRQSVEDSARAAGLGGALQKVDVNGELLEVRMKAVPHAQWLNWLDTVLRETRLRVVDLSVNREAQPGLVSMRLVLEAAKRESN